MIQINLTIQLMYLCRLAFTHTFLPLYLLFQLVDNRLLFPVYKTPIGTKKTNITYTAINLQCKPKLCK